MELLEKELRTAKGRDKPQLMWGGILVISGLFWSAIGVVGLSAADNFSIRTALGIFIVPSIFVIGAGCWVLNSLPKLPTLASIERRLHRQQQLILEKEREYKKDITQIFLNLATKFDQIPRATILPILDALVYCKSFTAILAFRTDELLILLTEDIRDVKIAVHEVARHGQISSNVPQALGGAAVGHLLFGAEGAIVGGIAGASAQKSTTEIAKHAHTVDLYTRLEPIPAVSVVFGQDDVAAKAYYGIISSVVL